MSQITLWNSIKALSSWLPSFASLLLYTFISVAKGLCRLPRKMCSRGSCHSRETSCHGSRSSCHDSGSSCHYTFQREPVPQFPCVTPCCTPVQRYCPPVQTYCPPVQRYCPPVQPYCPQYTKNICKLPPTYPKY
ncbi:putative small proline-rich protein 5 [Anser cygnoides]